MRAMAPNPGELPQAFSLMRLMVQQYVTQAGLHAEGPWMVVYHSPDYSERNLDVEVALVLGRSDFARGGTPPRKRLPSQTVNLRLLPAVEQVASCLYTGDGSKEDAYTALYAWTEQKNSSGQCSYQPGTPVRELLLDDPAGVKLPAGLKLPGWVPGKTSEVTEVLPAGLKLPAEGRMPEAVQEDSGGSEPSTRFTEIQIPVTSNLIYKEQFFANPYRKETEMEPTFVNLPAFTVVGMRYFGKNENQEIHAMWEDANKNFHKIKNVSREAAYGVCQNVPGAAEGEFEYIAGLQVSKVEDVPAGMVMRQVPAHKYAVFTHVGALDKLRDTYNYIYQVWLPKSGYKPLGGLDFEYYNEDFKDFAPDSRFYIYVALQE